MSERSADSIWETWLAFLVTKSSYFASHFGGRESTLRKLSGCVGDRLVFLLVSAGDDMVPEARFKTFAIDSGFQAVATPNRLVG